MRFPPSMVRYKHFYDKLFELNWEFSAQEEPTVKAVKSAKALAEPEKIPAKPAKEPSKSEKKPEEPTKESVEPTKKSAAKPTEESKWKSIKENSCGHDFPSCDSHWLNGQSNNLLSDRRSPASVRTVPAAARAVIFSWRINTEAATVMTGTM